MNRQWIHQRQRLTRFQIIGLALIALGIITLAGIALASLHFVPVKPVPMDESKLVAISFLFIMIGLGFAYPEVLMGPDKINYSSMRMVVFFIVCLFSFLVAKIGWTATSLNDFQINAGWAAVITAALGSKAVQCFGENRLPPIIENNNTNTNEVIPGGKNSMFGASGSKPESVIHDPGQISQTPPTTPPPHIQFT